MYIANYDICKSVYLCKLSLSKSDLFPWQVFTPILWDILTKTTTSTEKDTDFSQSEMELYRPVYLKNIHLDLIHQFET